MFDLYVIADGLPAPALTRAVERALRGARAGRIAVQLRCKELPRPARRVLAHRLRRVTAAQRAPLLVHGDWELAREAGAEGVHLPAGAVGAWKARRRLGSRSWIGVSCHDAHELDQARRAGADFALLSPVGAVPGKGPALGLERFAELARRAALPVFALGGVEAGNAGALRAAGAHGCAVIRAVLHAAEPEHAVAALLAAWDASPP